MTAVRTAGPLAGPGRFACPSASVPGRVHDVIWVGPATADCPCRGFLYRKSCAHVRAVADLVERERGAVRDRRQRAEERLREIAEEFGV